MIDIKKIEAASHIVIECDNETFARASALYSYILTLHKKVSLFCNEDLNKQFEFLPWSDKLRTVSPSSADLVISIEESSLELFFFFKNNEIKINKKMAISLYTGIFKNQNSFRNELSNGTVFATLGELITLGAEHKLYVKNLLQSLPLSLFRLKGIMFSTMRLTDNASKASLYLSEENLMSSGATLADSYNITMEVLDLVHVKEVVLIKIDENNKILHICKKEK